MDFQRTRAVGARLCTILAGAAFGPVLATAPPQMHPSFDADYQVVELGGVPGVPNHLGALAFDPANPDRLLVAGGAFFEGSAIYAVAVRRDETGHITGFDGVATHFADASGPLGGGIEGGLGYGPGGVLFYTTNDNTLGQLLPEHPRVLLGLEGLVENWATGLAFVPPGLPGAGRLKVASLVNSLHELSLEADGTGTFAISGAVQREPLTTAAQGLVYVDAGSPGIERASLLVAHQLGHAAIYDVDPAGDPILRTERAFFRQPDGSGAVYSGATADPATGDILVTVLRGTAGDDDPDTLALVRGFTQQDRAPEPFVLRDKRGVAPGTFVRSASVTLAGIDPGTWLQLGGDGSGAWSRNGGPFTSEGGAVDAGDQVQLRVRSGPLAGPAGAVTVQVAVGTYTTDFSVLTLSDRSPEPPDFADIAGAVADRSVVSAPVVPTGFTTPVRAAVTGEPTCRLIVGTGDLARRALVAPGQSLRLRVRSSPEPGASVGCSLTLADTVEAWTVTTAP